MSLTLLTKLEEILNNLFDYSPTTKSKIIQFFSKYHSNMWIYPGVLKRQLGMKIEDVYKLLAALEKCGFIESWYEYCCGHCQHVLGTVQRFNELPDNFECEVCGSIMPTIENTIKIYKVL